MSTPRGGEHRGGAQPPDDPGSLDPGLDHLIRALTVPGHPHERAGRDAALAAFRAASKQPHRGRLGLRSRGSAGQRRAPGASRWPRLLLPARLVAVAAAGFAVIAGVTAAAYAQALPAPVQHIAYSVFAPLGVPNSEPLSGTGDTSSSRSASPSSTVPASVAASQGGTQGGQSSPTASASGTDGYAITVTAASAQVPTGTRDLFTGRVSRRGHPAPGVKIRLLERTAGSPDWRLAASGVTGARGRVRLLSPRLTARATFRLAGPSGARSPRVTVTVTAASPVRLRLVSGRLTDRLIVTAPAANSGAVVSLMKLVGGAWQTVASKPLGPTLRTVFALPAASAAGHLYRAELGSTGSTPVLSKVVWVPRLPSTGAKIIKPSPSQSQSQSQSPSQSPSQSQSPAGPAPPHLAGFIRIKAPRSN